MILSAVLVLMALAAVAALAQPVLRKPQQAQPRSDFERGVLADQMAEIDRDEARGLIGTAEAEAARIELGRRALVRLDAPAPGPAPASGRKRPFALGTVIVLPLIAGLIYVALGRPRPARTALCRPRNRDRTENPAKPGNHDAGRRHNRIPRPRSTN